MVTLSDISSHKLMVIILNLTLFYLIQSIIIITISHQGIIYLYFIELSIINPRFLFLNPHMHLLLYYTCMASVCLFKVFHLSNLGNDDLIYSFNYHSNLMPLDLLDAPKPNNSFLSPPSLASLNLPRLLLPHFIPF